VLNASVMHVEHRAPTSAPLARVGAGGCRRWRMSAPAGWQARLRWYIGDRPIRWGIPREFPGAHRYFPIINTPVNRLLLGGLEVGQNTLIRFYTVHVIVLPLIAALLLAVHFWRIRKDGGISGPLW